MRKERALLAAVILVLALVCPGWAEQRTATFSWHTPDSWLNVYSGIASYPVLVRIYVGTRQVGAKYDNNIRETGTSITVTYDGHGRQTAIATAERMRGPRWVAATAYDAGAIVVRSEYSDLLGDLYFTATTAGTSGATEPTWSNVHGATITDGTVTWSVTNRTPKPWAASTAYNVDDRIQPPESAGLPGRIVFDCTLAGTSGATEPNWQAAMGEISPKRWWDRMWPRQWGVVTDGTAQWIWRYRSTLYALNSEGYDPSQRVVLQENNEVGKRWN